MKQNQYIIRGQYYTKEQIENLTFDQWAASRIMNMPKSLFKYFPNVIDIETGRNYSVEALENNTVFLQCPNKFDDVYDCSIVYDKSEFSFIRLKYYEHLCGFRIEETDIWKYIYFLSVKIYEKVVELQEQGFKLEDALKMVFHIRNDGSSIDKTHIMFVQQICLELQKNADRENVWQIAFESAINNEMNFLDKFLSRKFRVSCFTTSPFLNRMWASQYANNHKGFCIEYEVPKYTQDNCIIFHNLFPVIYSDVRTSVLTECIEFMEEKNDRKLYENIYKYGVLTKSLDWKDQDEWRLVSMDKMLASDYNCSFFKIKKVYFGNRMAKEERKKLIEICKRKDIEYSGIVNMMDRYELTCCLQDCALCNKLKMD